MHEKMKERAPHTNFFCPRVNGLRGVHPSFVFCLESCQIPLIAQELNRVHEDVGNRDETTG
jgi:hypothetical protein